ncbi:MAG: hypothetical protein LBM18_02575 [Oscillospiraceae bacterium]|jgi:hypothetical protein|nr:hypothetical protein [Oscillospiraceae bacterium]
MKKAKIKNIIILILVLVNGFLLAIVLSDYAERSRVAGESESAIIEILKGRAIALPEDFSLPNFVPGQVALSRDPSSEKRSLSAIIGSAQVTDEGGDIYLYSGKSGSGQARGTGEFSLNLTSSNVSVGDDPIETAASVLRRMNIDCTTRDADVSGSGGNCSVTLSCTYEGSVVWGSTVEVSFAGGKLSSISGRRLPENIESIYTPAAYPDAATIIMNFLRYLDSTGEVCTELAGIDTGYFPQVPQVGVFRLHPVWRIVSGVGKAYYFDAFTGEFIEP